MRSLFTALLAALLAHSALAYQYASEFKGRRGSLSPLTVETFIPENEMITTEKCLLPSGVKLVGVNANITEQNLRLHNASPSIAITDDMGTVIFKRQVQHKGNAIAYVTCFLDKAHHGGLAERAADFSAGAEARDSLQLPAAN